MTNEQAIGLFQALNGVGNLTGQKFAYAIARNINILKPIIKEYDDARIVLCESYAKKDEGGKSIMEDIKDEYGRPTKRYVFANEDDFKKESKKLNEEKIKEVNLFMIDIADVPAQITAGQMTGIYELLRETPTPKEKPKE